MLSPAQLRAARALIGWTREELAEASGVFANTIRNFEHGISDPKRSTLLKWRQVFDAAGIVFVDEDDTYGAGIRWKKGWPKGKR